MKTALLPSKMACITRMMQSYNVNEIPEHDGILLSMG